MRRILLAILIGLLSSGWLVPLYLGISSYMGGIEGILRKEEMANSFPYFEFAGQAVRLGTWWGVIAMGGWAAVGAHRLLGGRNSVMPAG